MELVPRENWLPASAKMIDPYADVRDPNAFAKRLHNLAAQQCLFTPDFPMWRGDLERIGASSNSLRNLARIQEGSPVVITGQQPCLLTGPALVFYKILTAVSLCREIEKEHSIKAVPVFWMASEDHDLAEMLHVDLPRLDRPPKRVRHSRYRESVAAETVGWDRELDELLKHLPEDFKPSLPTESRRFFSDHVASILYDCFAEEGLVIVEPRHLASNSEVFWRRVIDGRNKIVASLDGDERHLRDQGIPIQAPRRRPLPVFRLNQNTGLRTPLDLSDTGLGREERYSPGALLRPAYAQAGLKILTSVLGPSEFLYHQQNVTLFSELELPRPVLLPRQSAWVFDKVCLNLLKRVGISPADYLHMKGDTIMEIRDSLDEARRELELAAEKFLLASAKNAHAAPLPAFRRKIGHAIDYLSRKREKKEMELRGISGREVDAVRRRMFPRNRAQERSLNAPALLGTREQLEGLKRLFDNPLDYSGTIWQA